MIVGIMPLFGSHGLLAQDIFHTTDSKQIETKVLEVSDDEVSNKMFNAANGVKIGPLGAKTAKKCSQWTQFSSIGSTMAPHEQGLAKRPASSKTVGRRVRWPRRGCGCVMVDATICERQETGGQAEVPSRDGAGSATVRLATGEAKKELFAVKGRTRRTRLPRTLRSRRITKVRSRTDSRSCTAVRKERDYFSGEPGSLAM